MRGFPTIIQTRKDVQELLTLYPEQTKSYLKRLLDERMHFDDQGQWVENPKSTLAKMGVTAAEAIDWIGGDYEDPPEPVQAEPDMERLIDRAQRGWDLRVQEFVEYMPDGRDRYRHHHDTAMLDVSLQVMGVPESDRTSEMLTVMDRVNEVRTWKRQVMSKWQEVQAGLAGAETPAQIDQILEQAELDLQDLHETDPDVSLSELYI